MLYAFFSQIQQAQIYLFYCFLFFLIVKIIVSPLNMKNTISYAILVSFKHIGDYNQAKYVKMSYQKRPHNLFDIAIFDVECQQLDLQSFNVIHSIGEKALYYLQNIKKQNKLQGKKIIVQIHQHFPQIYKIIPDVLIIPKSSYVDHQNLKETRKLLLNGVFFEKYSKQQLKQFYLQSQISKNITPDEQYIIVMLSGDAPDQKNMRYFDKNSADMLFNRLVYILGRLSTVQIQPKIIVQNGPRTGKHDPQTGKQKCIHTYRKDQQDPSVAIDQVSLYFIQKLKSANIEHFFYNFSFEIGQSGRKINSFYKPLLYIACLKQNYFMFPMQSVSMCSQLPFYIEGSRLIAYHSSSTNDMHLKIVNEGYQQGRYQKIEGSGIGRLQFKTNYKNTNFDEMEMVLQQIIKVVERKQMIDVPI